MTARIGLLLEPLDVLFFRDGRPFEAGIRVGESTILPQTLSGALRTALLEAAGCDFAALGRAVQVGKTFGEALAEQSQSLADIGTMSVGGPWFFRDGQPLVPAPASLLRDRNGTTVRLQPLKGSLPGWTAPEPGMLPLWSRSQNRAERVSSYLTLEAADKFLAGEAPALDQLVPPDQLFDADARTGIVVSPETSTVETGMIYSADYLSLKPGVALYAEVSGPKAKVTPLFDRETAIPLGGQRRYVRVRRLPEPVLWPRHRREGGGSLLLLTTPAPFEAGWRPRNLDLIAAAIPGHQAFSGWDLALRGPSWDLALRGPKLTRFAVSAGAVYFCRGAAPERESLCESDDTLLGWGRFLEGVWQYA